jgi:regulation of enolase protein 1 (concanavalin A-like superfamily)
MVRLAHFPEGLAADVGPMACSASRAGLELGVHDLNLGPVMDKKAM